MRKSWLIISAAIFLAGCQTAEQRQAQDNDDKRWCHANGAIGSEVSKCMIDRENARSQARIARSQALLAAGQQLNNMAWQGVQPIQRPTTTTCRRLGPTVQCTTM